jgi:hypothetical protein
MQEGITSKVAAADRPYGKFYDFYSISLETFGSTHVYDLSSNEMAATHDRIYHTRAEIVVYRSV